MKSDPNRLWQVRALAADHGLAVREVGQAGGDVFALVNQTNREMRSQRGAMVGRGELVTVLRLHQIGGWLSSARAPERVGKEAPEAEASRRRLCPHCGLAKPESAFGAAPNGLCKECWATYMRESRAATKKYREMRETHQNLKETK